MNLQRGKRIGVHNFLVFIEQGMKARNGQPVVHHLHIQVHENIRKVIHAAQVSRPAG